MPRHSSDLSEPRPTVSRLPVNQFWALCFITFLILQLPLARIPILFLSTWAHELGHGLGALLTGGGFTSLKIYPSFSGVATTLTQTDFQRVVVIIMGLLGPSLLGAILIIGTRAFNWSRACLIGLTLMLLMSQLWAADLFTRATLGAAVLLIGLCAWKLPRTPILYLAHIIAIAFCLTALTGFGYFFIGNADISGALYRSDTGVLSDILGGPFWLWGALLTALSIFILISSVLFADRWARRIERRAF